MPVDPIAPYNPYQAVRAAEAGIEVTLPVASVSDPNVQRVREYIAEAEDQTVVTVSPAPVTADPGSPQTETGPVITPLVDSIPADQVVTSAAPVTEDPAAVTPDNGPVITALNDDGTAGVTLTSQEASNLAAATDKARAQATLAAASGAQNQRDWRLRLSLAPMSNYMYNAPTPAEQGILAPLNATKGVIFPYTPRLQMNYKAMYNQADATHSNYHAWFYQGSAVDSVSISAKFTAQTTSEANYLLAVIHFLRSVTKMFYGQDAQRGTPPPLLYLNGFGQYQFNQMPCVITNFNYSLPDDVDYIRAGSAVSNGTNQTPNRDLSGSSIGSMFGSLNRLAAAFLPKGAISSPSWLQTPPGTLNVRNPTYVPTSMEINITLNPIQSRTQVSQQFSLKNYANGSLLQGGFW